ncbi:MAG: HAD family hydrolase [Chloroflexi bacterium]|nr:MAG: HAD family hydrolase [Chloroflexota bacterium]
MTEFAPEQRRAVFLDRDGVLNEPVVVDGRPVPPDSLTDLVLTPGVEEACEELRSAGFLLILVTNQPDLARGTRDRATVDAINDELRRRLDLDDVLVCPHDDADRCMCRKPRPGLIHAAARRWHVDLPASVMVGDRWRDIEAGRGAGCRTILLERPYAERPATGADLVTGTLREAVIWIVGDSSPGDDG